MTNTLSTLLPSEFLAIGNKLELLKYTLKAKGEVFIQL